MITLTKASIVSRKTIRYTVIIVSLIIFARLTFLSGVNLYERFFPEPPPQPTVKFGKLPEIYFPINTEIPDACSIRYTIETINGTLPTFTEQAEVYFMPKPLSSIRALDKAKNIAGDLGFDRNGRELVETVFLFTSGNSPSSLNMNIVTSAFSISYDVNSDPQIFNEIPPTPDKAVSSIKGLLGKAKLLFDYRNGPTETQLLRIESGELVEAISPSEANLIKVNLFRKDYGKGEIKLPAVTPDPDEANVWFLISKARGSVRIIAGEYHYFPIDEKKFSTYPIKTVQQAWGDLINCNRYIARLGENDDGEIKIRNAYLAYYDSGQYTKYYQPVFVFEGENDFVAYVPAVTNNFYTSSESEKESGQ